MSDNVKGELDDIIASSVPHDPLRAYTIEVAVNQIIAHLAERGMVVLGPDGEPLDVRPALRALADQAMDGANWAAPYDSATLWLGSAGITGPLADACIAAAEVEP